MSRWFVFLSPPREGALFILQRLDVTWQYKAGTHHIPEFCTVLVAFETVLGVQGTGKSRSNPVNESFFDVNL
jgi:hypothetical protein